MQENDSFESTLLAQEQRSVENMEVLHEPKYVWILRVLRQVHVCGGCDDHPLPDGATALICFREPAIAVEMFKLENRPMGLYSMPVQRTFKMAKYLGKRMKADRLIVHESVEEYWTEYL